MNTPKILLVSTALAFSLYAATAQAKVTDRVNPSDRARAKELANAIKQETEWRDLENAQTRCGKVFVQFPHGSRGGKDVITARRTAIILLWVQNSDYVIRLSVGGETLQYFLPSRGTFDRIVKCLD